MTCTNVASLNMLFSILLLLRAYSNMCCSHRITPKLCTLLSHRQEKLEQLAEKFARKSLLRESWLADMTQILDELDNGRDMHSVDAALKRHEAIHTDVDARVSTLCSLVSTVECLKGD